MASNTKADKIEHPEHDTIALAAPVDPGSIRDIQDSIIPAGYGKISVLPNLGENAGRRH